MVQHNLTDATVLRRRAEQAVAHLPPLFVESLRVAAIVAQGEHGRRRVGPGETFWQFRRYQVGDAANMIDWRASARSNRLYIRENEWQAAESVWLWTDCSDSMRFKSHLAASSKLDRACLFTMALAVLLVNGGENIALLGRNTRPGTGSATLTRFATDLVHEMQDPGGGLPPLDELPQHARLVVVGDLLEPLEQFSSMIRHYSGSGINGHVVQITDPAEESLPYTGRILFEGLEMEGNVLAARSEELRTRYIDRWQAHRAGIRQLARSSSWSSFVHRTDSSLQSALLPFYTTLAGSAE